MRYEIRHISLRSILKFGVLIGALLGALPGICLGALAVQVINRVQQFLANIQNVDVNLPDIDLGIATVPLPSFTVDLIQALNLQAPTQAVNGWSAAGPTVFILILLGSIAACALMFVLPMLVFGLIYNGVAPFAGGFAVDLKGMKDEG